MRELAAGRVELEPGSAEVIADAPQKAAGDIAAPTVADAHVALLASARSEVLIASPYFVPGAEARATLAGLRARDVGVSVLTNSLATTDEPLVHYGYASHRPALLKAGIDLHELMPTAEATGDEPHAVDRQLGPRQQLAGPPAHQADGRRRGAHLRRLDEHGPALGPDQHRSRHRHPQRHAGAGGRQVPARPPGAGELQGAAAGRSAGWLSRQGGARSDEPRSPAEPAMPVRLLAQLLGEGVL